MTYYPLGPLPGAIGITIGAWIFYLLFYDEFGLWSIVPFIVFLPIMWGVSGFWVYLAIKEILKNRKRVKNRKRAGVMPHAG